MLFSLSTTYSYTRLVYHVFLSDSYAMPSGICGSLCHPVALRFQFPYPCLQFRHGITGGHDIGGVCLAFNLP